MVKTVFGKVHLSKCLEKVRDGKNTFVKVFLYIEIRAFHRESYKLVLWVSKFGVWHTKWGSQKQIL